MKTINRFTADDKVVVYGINEEEETYFICENGKIVEDGLSNEDLADRLSFDYNYNINTNSCGVKSIDDLPTYDELHETDGSFANSYVFKKNNKTAPMKSLDDREF